MYGELLGGGFIDHLPDPTNTATRSFDASVTSDFVPDFDSWLNDWLQEGYSNLSWIHDIKCGNFSRCSRTLTVMAKSEESLNERQVHFPILSRVNQQLFLGNQ